MTEIARCPFCANVPPFHNVKNGRVCCGTEDCPIAGKWIEVESWNRRPAAPDAEGETHE